MNREIQIVLFVIRMLSSIGFGILYSGLTLFLIQNLHMEKFIAISIVGVVISLRYALALIAGIMGVNQHLFLKFHRILINHL